MVKSLYRLALDHDVSDHDYRRRAYTIDNMGLREINGYVYCLADDALKIISMGYCGDFISTNRIKIVYEFKGE